MNTATLDTDQRSQVKTSPVGIRRSAVGTFSIPGDLTKRLDFFPVQLDPIGWLALEGLLDLLFYCRDPLGPFLRRRGTEFPFLLVVGHNLEAFFVLLVLFSTGS